MEKQVLFFGACYYSGLIKLARWWIQRSGRRLIILNYHRASGGDLRRHLLYLRRHYRMLPLKEALEELYAVDKKGKQLRDRRTPLVLTFDDGYRDNYTHGFPLTCELQVPITIFLIPTYIDGSRCFWWLEGDLLVSHAQVNEATIEGRIYHLDQQEDRKALVEAIYTRTCCARTVEEREAFLKQVREVLAVPPAVTTKGEAVLKWAEIHEVERSGWVSFGAHAMHHPVLAYLVNPAEVQCEVSECRTVMERQLGHPVRSFAYPLGRPEHIGKEALQAVREAGYDWAVTTSYGINTPQNDPLELQRIVGNVRWHWLLLAADISGMRQFFSPFFPYGSAIWSVGKSMVTLSLEF
jgi:peptidoglycan/xylan/chitin deacetylase (PgdA/CDA1 family)